MRITTSTTATMVNFRVRLAWAPLSSRTASMVSVGMTSWSASRVSSWQGEQVVATDRTEYPMTDLLERFLMRSRSRRSHHTLCHHDFGAHDRHPGRRDRTGTPSGAYFNGIGFGKEDGCNRPAYTSYIILST